MQRVLAHQEEQALLKAYIAEWRKFFTQCNYLPTPFRQLETYLAGKTGSNIQKRNLINDIVRKVKELKNFTCNNLYIFEIYTIFVFFFFYIVVNVG